MKRKGSIWGKRIKPNYERRKHYKLIRKAGIDSHKAKKIRDWSLFHINLYIENNREINKGDLK